MNFSTGSYRHYMLLSDPGLVRLRMASRALLTTALVCAVLVVIHRLLPMPASAYSIAMISAIQGVAAIKETSPSARAITRIYCAIAGFLVIATLTLLDHSLWQINALLLVVIFLAVYARRFSARWQAVGMFTFMCAVVGAFLKPEEMDLRSIALALLISGVVSHLVRNFVLPERPDADCRRAMKAAGILIEQLAALIAAQAAAGWSAAGQRQATELEHRARDAILLCESYLPLSAAGKFVDERAGLLAMRLFDLQLAVESALATALAPEVRGSGGVTPMLQGKLSALQQAVEKARTEIFAAPGQTFSTETAAAKSVSLFPPQGKRLSDIVVRQAVQVTIASAIAMLGGVALSQERWFWAVLTAFLIFSNTRSRGDLVVRALNRAFGTAIGIFIGIGLATLIHGELYWTVILAAICIFAAFYFGSLAYGAMTFFITIAIALIYGLIGVFTPGLLVLRLEETLVGVAAGMLVSLFVLPVSTVTQTREAIDHFLETLDLFMEKLIAKTDGTEQSDLLATIRLVDNARNNVSMAIGPMQSSWTFGLAQEKPRRALIRVSMLAHEGHILAREFADRAPARAEASRMSSIRTLLAELAAGNRDMSGRSRIVDMARLPQQMGGVAPVQPVENALDAITQVLNQADKRNQV